MLRLRSFVCPSLRRAGIVLSVFGLLSLAGCATRNPQDPLEPYNRAMFRINSDVDKVLLKPVATGYHNVTPPLVRRGVTNFFGNLDDLWSAGNDLLQGHIAEAFNGLLRVEVNTAFGLFGLLDVSTELGLYKHPNDLGLTLARYGIGSGPYFVMPLLGPSTVRDTVGTSVDVYEAPMFALTSSSVAARNGIAALRFVSRRADLLSTSELLEQIALDPYIFTRDAYLQRRDSRVREVRQTGLLSLGPEGEADAYLPAPETGASQPAAAQAPQP